MSRHPLSSQGGEEWKDGELFLGSSNMASNIRVCRVGLPERDDEGERGRLPQAAQQPHAAGYVFCCSRPAKRAAKRCRACNYRTQQRIRLVPVRAATVPRGRHKEPSGADPALVARRALTTAPESLCCGQAAKWHYEPVAAKQLAVRHASARGRLMPVCHAAPGNTRGCGSRCEGSQACQRGHRRQWRATLYGLSRQRCAARPIRAWPASTLEYMIGQLRFGNAASRAAPMVPTIWHRSRAA